MAVVEHEQELIVVCVSVPYVSPDREEDSVGLERFGGRGTADSSAVLQTGVLCDLDIRTRRYSRKLFPDCLRELRHVFAIEILSARRFSFAASGALFGISL